MDVYKDRVLSDFNGFFFNDTHSSTYGLIRISDGDRYKDTMVLPSKDEAADIPGGHGQYYWGESIGSRKFSIKVAYDNITEVEKRLIKKWLHPDDKLHGLIFDEKPYVKYWVKCSNEVVANELCFDEERMVGNTKQMVRIYKGEMQIEFTAYIPYGVCRDKNLTKYKNDYCKSTVNGVTSSNFDQWKNVSGLLDDTHLKYVEEFSPFTVQSNQHKISSARVYNPGDEEAGFKLSFDIEPQYNSVKNLRLYQPTGATVWYRTKSIPDNFWTGKTVFYVFIDGFRHQLIPTNKDGKDVVTRGSNSHGKNVQLRGKLEIRNGSAYPKFYAPADTTGRYVFVWSVRSHPWYPTFFEAKKKPDNVRTGCIYKAKIYNTEGVYKEDRSIIFNENLLYFPYIREENGEKLPISPIPQGNAAIDNTLGRVDIYAGTKKLGSTYFRTMTYKKGLNILRQTKIPESHWTSTKQQASPWYYTYVNGNRHAVKLTDYPYCTIYKEGASYTTVLTHGKVITEGNLSKIESDNNGQLYDVFNWCTKTNGNKEYYPELFTFTNVSNLPANKMYNMIDNQGNSYKAIVWRETTSNGYDKKGVYFPYLTNKQALKLPNNLTLKTSRMDQNVDIQIGLKKPANAKPFGATVFYNLTEKKANFWSDKPVIYVYLNGKRCQLQKNSTGTNTEYECYVDYIDNSGTTHTIYGNIKQPGEILEDGTVQNSPWCRWIPQTYGGRRYDSNLYIWQGAHQALYPTFYKVTKTSPSITIEDGKPYQCVINDRGVERPDRVWGVIFNKQTMYFINEPYTGVPKYAEDKSIMKTLYLQVGSENNYQDLCTVQLIEDARYPSKNFKLQIKGASNTDPRDWTEAQKMMLNGGKVIIDTNKKTINYQFKNAAGKVETVGLGGVLKSGSMFKIPNELLSNTTKNYDTSTVNMPNSGLANYLYNELYIDVIGANIKNPQIEYNYLYK